jgi:hypothetical protein
VSALKRWDIFCKIVDNFGDIGVCWRLARQLQLEHGLQIRLWIDDLEAAQKIIPSLNIAENSQVCDEITILKLSAEADYSQAAEVAIEAFACELPPVYLAAMVRQQSKWVNLEYLSAEKWVDDFHAKPSPQPNGLTRYFYFPGFTEVTGGLIREAHIAAQLQSHNNPRPQAGEGARLRGRGAVYGNLDAAPLSNLSPASGREAIKADELETSIPVRPSHFSSQFTGLENWGRPLRSELVEGQEALKVSLFCYQNAPINDLFTALQTNTPRHLPSNSVDEFDSPCSHAVSVYVPESSILPQIADYFEVETIKVGDYFTRDNLHVHILPFLSQAEYDALLRDCDLNFVRGEDSWIRAIWAGKPFIWQPYFQDENTHIKKLDAFLDVFYADLNAKEMVCEAYRYWSAGQTPKHVLHAYLEHLPAISSYTLQQSQQLANQQDLASKLVIFCNKI